MVCDADPAGASNSFSVRIFIFVSRLRWIFRATTTNQEVASSSLAGRANLRWSIPDTWVTVHSGDIGNTFGPKGLSIGSSLTRLVVEVAQVVLHEGDEPDRSLDLRDADLLPGEDVTEIDLAGFPADPAAVGHHDRRVVKRIGELLQAAIDAGVSACRRPPALSSRALGAAARGCSASRSHRTAPAVGARWRRRVWSLPSSGSDACARGGHSARDARA